MLANDSDPNAAARRSKSPIRPTRHADPERQRLHGHTPNAGSASAGHLHLQSERRRRRQHTATVTITVNQGNDPPAANDDTYAFTGNTLSVPAASSVLTNDTDPNVRQPFGAARNGAEHGHAHAQPGWLVRVHSPRKASRASPRLRGQRRQRRHRPGHRDHPQQG